jgi:hypothetical protein
METRQYEIEYLFALRGLELFVAEGNRRLSLFDSNAPSPFVYPSKPIEPICPVEPNRERYSHYSEWEWIKGVAWGIGLSFFVSAVVAFVLGIIISIFNGQVTT